MIFLSLLILIVAVALPSINKNINSILYIRITSIIFIYSGALSLNAFYIQSIGSGIGSYGLVILTNIYFLFVLNNNNWYAFNFDYLFLIFNLTGYSFISSLSKNYKLVTDVESGNNNNNDNNILLYSSLSLTLKDRGRRAKQTPTQIKDKDKQIQDTHSSSDINLSLVENSNRDGYLKRFKKLVINCSLFLKNNRNNVISIFVLCNIFVIFCFNISVSDLSILKSLFYVCVIIISFTFSLVISNIYNWSDNYFIRSVQKSIFYSILTLIGYLLLFYFGININILCYNFREKVK